MVRKDKKQGRRRTATFFGAFAFLLLVCLPLKPAKACCICGCPCGTIASYHEETVQVINDHTTEEHNLHQDWLAFTWWDKFMHPNLQKMAEQMTAATLMNAEAIGMFMDAESQLKTQRLLQDRMAEAHKDYIPSETLCKMGTLNRSMVESERRATITQAAMSTGSIDRQLGLIHMISAESPDSDEQSRFKHFQNTYCDPSDHNRAFEALCPTGPTPRVNRDIDYTRTIGSELSLNVDFVDKNKTTEEEDVIALARNLYANDLFSQRTIRELRNEGKQDEYLDLRSVVAKRSVAENSFNAIMGLKTGGTISAGGPPSANADTTDPKFFMTRLLEELGMPEDETKRYVGSNPSYYSQMEVLTKKVFQDPAFIANLYDTPANVKRQYAAMQSLGLTQQREMFDSTLRTEMLLSVLLELEVAKYQKRVQNEINKLTPSGKKRM